MRSIVLLSFFLLGWLSLSAQFNNNNNRNRNWNNNRRVPSISFGLEVATPQNQFNNNFDGTPVGFSGQFLSNLGRSPFELGFGFSWLSRGTVSEEIWIYEGVDAEGDEVFGRGEVDVNSNIYTYTGVARLKPFAGAIQPYGDVIAGVRNFSTVTVITPDDSEEIETRERQHGDFTYTYGWAAGLKVRVTPVLFVEGRFSSLYGGPIDFVDRESIQIGEEGGITFDNVSSRTDMHIIEAGISFEF